MGTSYRYFDKEHFETTSGSKVMAQIVVEIDWDQPGDILSPGCPHHPCL